MTKQIDLPVRTRYRPTKASWYDRLVALTAILIVLIIVAIVSGGLLWVALKIWGSVVSMM